MKKPKILFINPWITDFTAYNLWSRPLGLLYIMSVVKNDYNIDVELIDCINHPSAIGKIKEDGTNTINYFEIEKPQIFKNIPRKFKAFGMPTEIFEKEIKKIGKIDAVFITSMMTYWYPGIRMVIEQIKKNIGSIPIVLGGIYATLMTEHAKNLEVDLIIKGEGEDKIKDILDKILVIKSYKKYEETNNIHFPYFSALENKNVLPFMTSRGCPFRCSYCASFLISNFKQRSIQNCIEELEFIRKNYRTKHIAFYDDALLLNKEERIKPLLKEIINRNFNFNFHTPNGLHINSIDEELVYLMKKANFKTLRLSIESTNKDFFKKTNSAHKISDLRKVVEIIKKAGYKESEILTYVMVGLPYQESDEVKETIKYIGSFGIKVSLSYFSPVPGTIDYRKMKDDKLLPQEEDPLLHNKIIFPYFWSKITPSQLEEIKILQHKININKE